MKRSPCYSVLNLLILLCITLESSHALGCMSPSGESSRDRLLIVGYGRVGQQVSRLLQERATSSIHRDEDLREDEPTMEILATTRRPSVLDSERGSSETTGVRMIPFEQAEDHLATCSHVLISMPLNAIKPTSPLLLQKLLMASPSVRWIGVISTTSVYGDHQGIWVTEESDCLVDDDNPYRQVEQFLLEHNNQPKRRSVCVFRCAGIYGGDQSALHTVFKEACLQQGGSSTRDSTAASLSASTVTSNNKTNRIHVYDLASAVVAATEQTASGIYNLADNEPETRAVVMDYARQLLQSAAVVVRTAESGEENSTAQSASAYDTSPDPTKTSSSRSSRRGTDRKLVSNQRMRQDLLPELQYPSYREGLQAILRDPWGPWWSTRSS
jgi:nucleoside-diphosphate-sugar epimerase